MKGLTCRDWAETRVTLSPLLGLSVDKLLETTNKKNVVGKLLETTNKKNVVVGNWKVGCRKVVVGKLLSESCCRKLESWL